MLVKSRKLIEQPDEWLETTGRIVYDPDRKGMKRRTQWWCVLDTDNEITRYYRWWVKKELHVDLKMPSWGGHVSIIRGEKPPKHLDHLWKKYHNKRVKIRYRPWVRQSGDTTGGDRPSHFWFLEVDAPFLIDIRKEFGFPHNWKLHMTIGRTY